MGYASAWEEGAGDGGRDGEVCSAVNYITVILIVSEELRLRFSFVYVFFISKGNFYRFY